MTYLMNFVLYMAGLTFATAGIGRLFGNAWAFVALGVGVMLIVVVDELSPWE